MVTNWIWVLYKIVTIYFAQVKLYPLFQNWEGVDAGRFSTTSVVLPSRTQLESREEEGIPDSRWAFFSFLTLAVLSASRIWVSLLVDCLGRYHTPVGKYWEASLRQVRSVWVEPLGMQWLIVVFLGVVILFWSWSSFHVVPCDSERPHRCL